MKNVKKKKRQRRKRKIRLINTFIIILILLVATASCAFIFYKDSISAVSKTSEKVTVRIDSGLGAYQVLDKLEEEGLIKNKKAAKLYVKLNHINSAQANTYILDKTMSLKEIFKILENPDDEHTVHVKFTVKDGNTIPQVSEEAASLLNITAEEVINKWSDPEYLNSLIDNYWFIDNSILNSDIMFPLEGYFYPETYYITEENPTIEDITKYALDMMNEKLTPYKDSISSMNWTPHQFLTFVSIVERESLFDEDKAKIAGVLINRLNIDMLLQVDCTVNYAWQKTGIEVSYDHLKIDSKYNTYMYKGLPAGPISTVSEDTIKDCINYDHNDYIYFFAKEDGSVIYSKTIEEHNAAVENNKWY